MKGFKMKSKEKNWFVMTARHLFLSIAWISTSLCDLCSVASSVSVLQPLLGIYYPWWNKLLQREVTRGLLLGLVLLVFPFLEALQHNTLQETISVIGTEFGELSSFFLSLGNKQMYFLITELCCRHINLKPGRKDQQVLRVIWDLLMFHEDN